MEETELLRKLDLNETESIIYLQLLKKGELSAVNLSKETKIHRRTIYDNLNILINKGFVTFVIKKDVRYFNANNPKRFSTILKEKEDALKEIIPKLSKYYISNKKSPNVSVLQGIDSATIILEEMFETKKEILWMGGGSKIFQHLNYSTQKLFKKLSEKKLRIIQPKTKEISELKKYFSKKIHYLPESYESDVAFFVYENTVILGLTLLNEIFVIKIESEEFAKAYTNYFNLIKLNSK